MSDTTTAAQIEAFRDLTTSQGWKLYCEAVMGEIEGKFADEITRALDNGNSDLALDKMRQVAAVRLAGLRWLKLPQERLAQLTDKVDHARETKDAHLVGRRPVGL